MSKNFFEVQGPRGETLDIPYPVPGNEIWVITRRTKRDCNGRLYTSRKATDVVAVKACVSDITLTTHYAYNREPRDYEGTLVWYGTAYPLEKEMVFQSISICAGNVAKTEEEAKRLLPFFQENGLEFDCDFQVKCAPGKVVSG